MKQKSILLPIILGVFCLASSSVRAQTNYTFTSGSINASIPDGSPVGYTTSTSIAGLGGYVSSVQVNLNITGGFNGDLYAYLLGPQGGIAFLLNRVGLTAGNPFGYGDAGFNVTLSDGAANIHNYQSGSYTLSSGQLTGTWAPDGRAIDPNSAGSVFDAASTSASLGVFNGLVPNGTWTLYLADLSGGGQSTLVSWGMTIVTVPEPQTWALALSGVGMLLAFRRRSL